MCLHPIVEMPTGKLRPNKRNARTHSKKQVEQIVNSIRQFGWTYPILIDELGNILCGAGRWLAAQRMGLAKVPVISLTHLSDAKKRALVVADNKIAANSSWDRKRLAAEFVELDILLREIGLTPEITGFETAEIESLMVDFVDPERDPADELPQLVGKSTSRSDDLWQLGSHRILCGDSCEEAHVRALMGRRLAAMIFGDPPFNIRIKEVVGRGKIKHREFSFASGEMSPSQFIVFLKKWMKLAAQFSEDGSIHYICMDWRHLAEIIAAGEAIFTELKNVVVWAKTNAGQGSFYRSQHEFVFVFKNGDGPHQNNIELGRHGRNRSSVWTYAGVNTFRAGRLDELTVHPTVKPVALVADAMRDCRAVAKLSLIPSWDPAPRSSPLKKSADAHTAWRSTGYVDVAVKRWQDFTKRDAILKATGQTFDEVAAERASDGSTK